MPRARWEIPDIESMLKRDELPEATTTANVGPYQVPLGPVLRRPDLTGAEDDLDIPEAYREILGLPRKIRK